MKNKKSQLKFGKIMIFLIIILIIFVTIVIITNIAKKQEFIVYKETECAIAKQKIQNYVIECEDKKENASEFYWDCNEEFLVGFPQNINICLREIDPFIHWKIFGCEVIPKNIEETDSEIRECKHIKVDGIYHSDFFTPKERISYEWINDYCRNYSCRYLSDEICDEDWKNCVCPEYKCFDTYYIEVKK